MAAGGHLHFVNDHDASRIKDNHTLNKMMPVWHKSVKTVLKLSHLLYFSLLPFLGWEIEGRQDSNAAGILETSVLSKMAPF
jgi:hypothetical protein